MKRHPRGQRLSHQADLLLVIAATPGYLLLGGPLAGYALGACAWGVLRALGHAVRRRTETATHISEQVALLASYRLLRLTLFAGATVLALATGGKADGLATLLVIVSASTVRLLLSPRDGAAQLTGQRDMR